MMGLDYTEKEKSNGKELFESIYTDEKYICYQKPREEVENETELERNIRKAKETCEIYEIYDQKPIDSEKTLREIMAIQEHYRWNSFMISHGVVPATLEEMEKFGKSAKRYDAPRRHGNITTMQGLIEYRQNVAKAQMNKEGADQKYDSLKTAEILSDVIKYDYQILDDAIMLLNSQGYEITEKISAD